MKFEFLSPPTLNPTNGWTHVITATGGKTIYVSGQTSVNERGELVGKGDLKAQVVQTFENLKHALTSAGATFKDVVKINNYLTDMSHIGIFREVRDEFVHTASPPASTTVAISQLARPGALFEVEAIAVLPVKTTAKPAAAKGKSNASRKKRR